MGTSRRWFLSFGVTRIGEGSCLCGLMCSNFKSPKLGEKSLLQCGCSVFLSSYCALTHPSKAGLNPFFMWHKSPVRPLLVSPLKVLTQCWEEQGLMRDWRCAHTKWELKLVACLRLFNTLLHEYRRESAGHILKLLTLMAVELCKQKLVSVWEALLKAA